MTLAMSEGALGAPRLDTGVEPWRGEFPGLGEVRIHADGRFEVDPEPVPGEPDETTLQRRRALVHGWAEPLALSRQGFLMVLGSALAMPDQAECVVCFGGVHDVARFSLALGERSWRCLADWMTPLELSDAGLVAHGRSAPVLLSSGRAEKEGLAGEQVRDDTDALAIDVLRAPGPLPVRALIEVRQHRASQGDAFVPLAGYEKFDVVGQMLAGGVYCDDPDPADDVRRRSSLARWPLARFGVGRSIAADDVDRLISWVAAS